MVDVPQTQRFQAWVAALVFTTVSLAAHASADNWDSDNKGKWVIGALSINVILSFIGVVSYIWLKKWFVGKYLEGGVGFVMLLLWCGALASIMNPDNNIALNGRAGIINPNLFFFSWVAFVCSLYVFGNYAQEASGRDLSVDTSAKHSKWGALMAACLVILITTANIATDMGCTGDNPKTESDKFCRRNNFGIALGVIGSIFPLIVLLAMRFDKMVTMVDRVVTFIMVGMTTAGVAVITFNEGSGTQMSNLYFATWIAFGISILLGAEGAKEYSEERAACGGEEEPEGGGDEEKGDKSPDNEEMEQPMNPDTAESVEVPKEADDA